MFRRSIALFALVAVIAAIGGALLARQLLPPPLHLRVGTWMSRPRMLPQFHLHDLSGNDFTRAALRGHPTLLYFGYTNCPDECPTMLATLTELQRTPPIPGARVVFVTIDPARDNAANLQVYLAAFSKAFIGVRGSQAALAPLLRALHVRAVKHRLPDGTYTINHSTTLYLLDRRARLRAEFNPPFSTAQLAGDLRQIALRF